MVFEDREVEFAHEGMPEGWQEDPAALNQYAWWRLKAMPGFFLFSAMVQCGEKSELAIEKSRAAKARREVNELRKVEFNPGDVIVFDRGYTDFKLFAKYCNTGIYFIIFFRESFINPFRIS